MQGTLDPQKPETAREDERNRLARDLHDELGSLLTSAKLDAAGLPARYVSGYLLATEGETPEEASHAWAEIHVNHLGWVGFDAANQMCPDERYVRVAVGRDYRDAAPVRGAGVKA